jgi:DNA-binding NarL/FixJ family response regulator
MTVLVIADQPGITNFVRRGLEAAGFTVVTETDGQVGLLTAQRDDVDLVVLDLGLPGLPRDAARRSGGLWVAPTTANPPDPPRLAHPNNDQVTVA